MTFDANGGLFGSAKTLTQKIFRTETAMEPANPTKTGENGSSIEFQGWYSDPQLTQPFDFSTPITTDITLHANWHTHDWEYKLTADKTGIQAVCRGDNCDLTNKLGGTATLAEDESVSKVYTGKEIKALKVTYSEDWLPADKPTEITYSNNVNAGTGTASGSITIGDVTATKNFTISKATPTVTITSELSKPYDGTPVSGLKYTFDGDGEVTIAYRLGEDGTDTFENAPQDAGKYYVRVSVAESNNYTANQAEKPFTISDAELTGVSVTQKAPLTYTGSEQTASVTTAATAVGGQRVSFTYCATQDDDYTYTVPGFTDAGDHTVYYRAIANNHTAATGSFTVTIGKAANEWTTAPAITGWTYGETAVTPTAAAKFGTATVTYTGKQNDGTDYNSTTAPTEAGSYTATFTVPESGNYVPLSKDIPFTISRAAALSAPAGIAKAQNETIEGKGDGKISGLTTAMEYRTSATEDYSPVTDPNMTFPAFIYYVRYAQTSNHLASQDYGPIVIDKGRRLKLTVPAEQVGYTVTVTPKDVAYNGTAELAFTLHPGYSQTGDFAVKVNEEAVSLTDSKYTISNIQEDKAITVTGVADITAPTATVTMEESKWDKFLTDITFGLYYAKDVDITVAPADEGSGVSSVAYLESGTAMTMDALQSASWTNMGADFKLTVSKEDAKKFVYYFRVTDNAGNAACFSTNGAVFDTQLPVIEGVTGSSTYYTTQSVTVTDTNLTQVTVTGLATQPTVTGGKSEFTLPGNVSAAYAIEAVDRAGNKSTVANITMRPISDLSAPVKDLTTANVTSADTAAINAVKDTIAAVQQQNKTEAEAQLLTQAAASAQSLLDQITAAGAAANTQNVQDTKKTDSENVKLEDQKKLEDALADLKAAIDKDKKNNYTSTELEAINADIDRLEKALASIEKVNTLTSDVKALPDTITTDLKGQSTKEEKAETEQAILDAQKDYQALSEHEKSLVDKSYVKKLNSLVSTLTDYKFTSAGKKWTKGSGKSLSFTVNGYFDKTYGPYLGQNAYGKFLRVEVDGKALTKDVHYTVESGSTIIQLKASYLEKLRTGKHTITAHYLDGHTEKAATFQIISGDNPVTGDTTNILLLSGILLTSAAMLAVLLLARRKPARKGKYHR